MSIYSLYGCKNAEQLYKKVKSGNEEVKGLIDFIEYLKRDREREAPLISSNIKLKDYLKENSNRTDGTYVLLLDAQNVLIKDFKAKSENKKKEIIEEALNNNAKSMIIVNWDKEEGQLKTTAQEISEISALKKNAKIFEIGILDNVTVGKEEYVSYLERGILNEEASVYSYLSLDKTEKEEGFVKEYNDSYIGNFKEIEKSSDFFKHYTEKEIKGLSMTKDFDKIKESLKVELSEKEKEIFSIMYIDRKNRIIKKENIFEGTLDKSIIYMRELGKKLINEKIEFSGIVAIHNHPAGSKTPSSADIELTEKIKEGLKIFEIDVKDHLIVSRKGVSSFLELKLLENKYSPEPAKLFNIDKIKRKNKEKELER